MTGNMSRQTWAILASTASLLGATSALAQTMPAVQPGTSTAPVQATPGTPTAAEQNQDTQSNGLGDIIVTAQRRSENLQDVPISITAASAAVLAEARVDNISNIQAISPSISFRVSNNPASSANIIIRGLGTTGINRSFEGSVGVFIDGVYRTRAGSALQNFLDIDNLQVLRGPQGTLFGKNTTAGALLLTSAAPKLDRVEGLFDVSYGNYNTVLARAAINVPLADALSFRVAGLVSTRDGFFTDATTGHTLNDDSTQAVKAQLLYEPSDRFSIRLIGDYSTSDGNCCYGTANYVNGPTQPLIDALTLANGRVVPPTGLGSFRQSIDGTNRQRIEDYGTTALIKLAVGNGEIHSVTAWRKFSVRQHDADADFSGANLLLFSEDFDSRFVSQEVTYTGKIKPLNADLVVGGFFSDEKLTMARDILWGSQAQTFWDRLLGAAGVPAGLVEAAPGRTATEALGGKARSYAAFGHLDFALGSKFNVIAGLRYSIEEKEGRFHNPYFDPNPLAIFRVLGVTPGPAYDVSTTNKSLSGTFGVQFRPVDDVMLYATYNRGFKAGGVNIDANGAGTLLNNPADFNSLPPAVQGLIFAFNPGKTLTQPLSPVYKPETVNAFEVGAKVEYFDRRARTNISLFYYDLSDVQIAQYVGLRYAILNAQSAEDYGIEIENLFRLTPAITLGLDGTWLPRANYANDPNIDPVLSGSRFRFAPKFQGNATVNLDQSLSNSVNLVGRVQYQYSGPQLINTASLSSRGDVSLINVNLGFKLKSGLIVEGFAQNLTNKIYASQSFNTPLQAGDENAYLAPPRTYGIHLRTPF